MNILGPRLSFFRAVDDVLEIFHTHLVGGVVGGFLVGIFATAEGCAAFALTSPGGAIAGNGKQIGWQLAGALFIIGWNVVSSLSLSLPYPIPPSFNPSTSLPQSSLSLLNPLLPPSHLHFTTLTNHPGNNLPHLPLHKTHPSHSPPHDRRRLSHRRRCYPW